MKLQTFFAYDPADSDERRVEKFAIFLVASACCLAGVVWTAMYYVVFGPGFTTWLPLLFLVCVGSSLVISHLTRNHWIAVYSQIICIIYITALIQWSIGGAFESGLVMIWAFLGPLIALMFFSVRQSVGWLLLYLLNITITLVFNDYFASHGQGVSDEVSMFFFWMNLSIASVVVFVFAGYFVISAVNEREKANRLLLNVLPKEIAPALKSGTRSIAEHYDSASVLFADIVGSTPLFSRLTPDEAVEWLNEVFSLLDTLVEQHGLEKIRTIGDSYMVAAGVPVPDRKHAQAIGDFALEMMAALNQAPARNGQRLAFRVGINSGPLVAGVIGQSKFHYDLWGDTVNTASRMESHGQPGKVQVTQATYELLKDDFEFVARGPINVKGKDTMETYFLVGRKAGSGQ
ncbi:MAG: adenylate/guanylate cyclase domain-containing protein [Chloroflexota bacterium]